MKKIISLFKRDYAGNKLVVNEVVPGAEWVLAGEGVATRKYDGTCCLVEAGKLFKRYEVKAGATAPAGFRPAGEVDGVTGKQQGWLPVSATAAEDKWHREAWANSCRMMVWPHAADEVLPDLDDGSYELLGPKINGNPEKAAIHFLERHGTEVFAGTPTTFDELREWLDQRDIEGIVWHHADGRMVKIKKKDFGLKRWG